MDFLAQLFFMYVSETVSSLSTAGLHFEKPKLKKCGFHLVKITVSKITLSYSMQPKKDALQILEFKNVSCKVFFNHLQS